jgi:hypothetical protein
MPTLGARGAERLDRFLAGGVRNRWPLRTHTLVRRARGGLDLAKSLSPGSYSARLPVELPPLALWRGILRRNMRGAPAGSAGPSGYGTQYRSQHSLPEPVSRGVGDLSSYTFPPDEPMRSSQECAPCHVLDRGGDPRGSSFLTSRPKRTWSSPGI